MTKYRCLNDLNPGEKGRILSLTADKDLRRRLLDLGLTPDTQVSCVGKSPAGDPAAFLIRGSVIAIRKRDGEQILIEKTASSQPLVAIAGNPNVGKSTLFNQLTGMRQHTGNWSGKTVENATGLLKTPLRSYRLADIPGAYSLLARSPEEEEARDFLCFQGADAALVVCDATCLERNLNLTLQILELMPKVLVCVNLMDEAEHKKIEIDLDKLSKELSVPVIGISARDKKSVQKVTDALDRLMEAPGTSPSRPVSYAPPLEAALALLTPLLAQKIGSLIPARFLALRLLEGNGSLEERLQEFFGFSLREEKSVAQALLEAKAALSAAGIEAERISDSITESLMNRAREIFLSCVQEKGEDPRGRDRKLDRLFTSKKSGSLFMLLLLALVFWLTIWGANYPSRLLSHLLFGLQDKLTALFSLLHAPSWLHGLLVLGAYRVLAWVISVMLPPMAIFFPLFTLLEDFGYLPRVAYNLDHAFSRCRSCGKQALTMCMGFGCNAVGVTGCRIIHSPRERLIAILTNSFVPCNGRFPMLIALISMFFAGNSGTFAASLQSALLLTLLVLLGISLTLLTSRILSATLLKGLPSAFTLELPPYRKPQIGKVLLNSLLERTLFVLGRALATAAPAGALIWLLANIRLGSGNIISLLADFLDPAASFFGLDGVILLAFLLGLPANEIVIPLMLMAYLGQGVLTDPGSLEALRELFIAQGWTLTTAACTLLFALFHWPCAATLMTVRRETRSIPWTLLAFILPTATGLILCFLTSRLLGLLL